MTDSLKHKTISGVVWSSIERFSVQGVQFLVLIVMARLLTPKDYGLVGMLAVFLAVSQSLIDSGFSQALIRKQNRTEVDNSTVFYFNIGVGFFLYIVLFFAAPFISDFYDTPELTNITRVLSLSVVVNSLTVVQRALLTVKIDFKTQAKASFLATLLSGVVGISMAYSGMGVWALVTQQLVNFGVNAIALSVIAKWRPVLSFSWKSFRELFSFGSKLLISGLLDTIYRNLYLIVIGKKFAVSDLGFYTRAQHFAEFPSSNITGVLQRVTYPVLCHLQDDNERLATNYRKLLRISAFVIFPMMMGLAALAKPFVLVLLKDQWLFAAVLLQIICFSMMWYPIHAINLNLLQVKGRSDLFLRLEIWKKVIGVCVLCVTIPLGLKAMCYGSIVSSLIALFINTYYTGKLIKVGFVVQMKDLFPIICYSMTMGVLISFVISYMSSPLLQLTVGCLVGFAYYLIITWVSKSKELFDLISIIKHNDGK